MSAGRGGEGVGRGDAHAVEVGQPLRLEVHHLDFHAPVAVPLVDLGGERQATPPAVGHDVVEPVAHAPRHRPHRGAALPHSEAQVPLALPDPPRGALDLHVGGQEPRAGVVLPVGFELVDVAEQLERQRRERHLGVELKLRRGRAVGEGAEDVLAEPLAEGVQIRRLHPHADRGRVPAVPLQQVGARRHRLV